MFTFAGTLVPNHLKKKILIVDDEEDLTEILQFNLESEGFAIEVAHSAEEALKLPVSQYDLILLDIMMGGISGYKFANIIRTEQNVKTPIIFLSAKNTENDLLTGFNLGADDYISKPFSIKEVIARVNAVILRTSLSKAKKSKTKTLKVDKLKIDLDRKKVRIDDEKVEMTKKEFEILVLLLQNEGKLYSREDILNKIWSMDVIVIDRTVDVNIARIRKKLGPYGKMIKSRSGYGYFFEKS
ncbi:MAG: two-component system alkaline phosphatase synthesis response regulator PhoP [Patiriisocius sp.]|jgi:two-component system alkaline phosphatase synthesis response regulator PhoP